MRVFKIGVTVFFAAILPNLHAADEQSSLEKAKKFLAENQIWPKPKAVVTGYAVIHQKIAAKPDPASKFGYAVFSIARHSSKLLTEKQAAKIDVIIAARQESEPNWHDVRNIVRVQAGYKLWDYAAERDEVKVGREKSAWDSWTVLRVAYMEEEFLAKDRFQRAVWNVLTPEQHEKIRAGEWDEFLKKSEGHGRFFSADKQVLRELGKPENQAAFDVVVKKWKAAWEPMLTKYWGASRFQNCREFHMDLAGEGFALESWRTEYRAAFIDFVTMERNAIREIVQAGYDSDLSKKIATTKSKFHNQAVKKYSAKADAFLRLLGEIE